MVWLDSLIAMLSPEWGLRRQAARNALQLSAGRGFRSARPGRLNRAKPQSGSADYHTEVQRDRRDQVDISRQLVRDNCVPDGMLQRVAENVIGPEGLKPQAGTESEDWNRKAEELWTEWGYREADVRKLATFPELQRLLCRTWLRDGDVGLIKRSDGRLQTVLSDQLASPPGKELDARFRDGIELDRDGAPARFYVVDDPDADLTNPNRRYTTKRRVIDTRDFIFLARRADPEQTRGMPVFAQAEHLFEHLDGLIEAVVVAARMAACYGLVIETPYGPNQTLPQNPGANGALYRTENIEPGSVKYLELGEKMSQLTPSQPATNFSDFVAALARLCGLQLGLPLELVFLDFSRTNYSSARAALLQAYRAFECLQAYFGDHLMRAVWEWQVGRWIAQGKLRPRADWRKVTFVAPAWQWIDPVKELQGAALELDLGLATWAEMVRRLGKDAETMFKARTEELKKRKKEGWPDVRSTLTRDPQENTSPQADRQGDEERKAA